MTFTEQDVEKIVVEVIRRLGLLGARDGQGSVTGELVLIENVVTLRSLDGKLQGITRVVVTPRTVVTPAVRDELKQRQIALIRQNSK